MRPDIEMLLVVKEGTGRCAECNSFLPHHAHELGCSQRDMLERAEKAEPTYAANPIGE